MIVTEFTWKAGSAMSGREVYVHGFDPKVITPSLYWWN